VIGGRLGLLLAVPPGYATAIFPPAGIAMAASVIGGRRTLPWILFGSFVLNAWIGAALDPQDVRLLIGVAAWIAVASCAQAALGAWVLRRCIRYPMLLDNPRDLACFLLIAPAVCVTSASLSLCGMLALGTVGLAQLPSNWFAWWIGDSLGTLLFVPLIMIGAGEPRAFWRGRAIPVGLPMLLFFALFVAIFVRTRSWEQEQSLVEFRLVAQGFSDRLRSALQAQENLLAQLGAFWCGSGAISRAQFHDLTERLLQRFPEIRGIEWAPRIPAADRAAFERAQQHDVPGFTILARTPSGALAPSAQRPEYTPVTYVEPLRGNETAIGFDLASEPTRNAALQATVATGNAAATAPITLVQEPNDRSGILLLLDIPASANGPGALLLVLSKRVLVRTLLGPADRVLEVTFADQQASPPQPAPPSPANFRQQLSFGGRGYILRATPTPAYLDRHPTWQSWAVLVVGALSTSLLGALLMLGTGERVRFARLLAQRTRERDRIWQVSEDLLAVSNFEGYFPSVNPAWTKTLGWSEEEIRTLHVDALRHPDDMAVGREGRRRLAQGAGTVRLENRFRHKDGTWRWISWTMTAEQGLIYLIGRDVTADREAANTHRRTEDQLRQLQKMDSVGQLTGGIAHDFNNLLTIIIGNLEVLQRALTNTSERVTRAIGSAMIGASRAAALTQRLLAFAQRQPLRPRAVNLNELIVGMGDLIRRTHGEMIEFEFALGGKLPLCFCDANQMETALLNLVINARDAMPQGGRLRIETAKFELDAAAAEAQRHRTGTVPRPRRARHRHRHVRRNDRARLRAVLHHQGSGTGHRPRPQHGLWFRQAVEGAHRNREPARRRHHDPHHAARAGRRRRPRRQRC
jgi:PAS domain S-box-containing protein